MFQRIQTQSPAPLRWPCRVVVVCTGLLALLVGCGGRGPASHPRSVVDSYVAAIKANRPDRAYALLSGPARRSVSSRAFAEQWRQVRPELRRQATALTRPPSTGRPPLTVTARYPYNLRLKLTQQSRLWGVDPGHLTAPAHGTPERAALALTEVIRQRDLPGLWQLMSLRGRKELAKTFDGRMRAIQQALAKGFTVSGDRAVLQYSRDHALVLVKEGNLWKIRSLE